MGLNCYRVSLNSKSHIPILIGGEYLPMEKKSLKAIEQILFGGWRYCGMRMEKSSVNYKLRVVIN